jgi:F420-non-reducing hydrogenase iron-sulfur subunit
VGKNEFEPKIVGFYCNWRSYAGADIAGVSRFQYPPNKDNKGDALRRVIPAFVLKA